MKQFLTATVISISLLAAGCSSDGTPASTSTTTSNSVTSPTVASSMISSLENGSAAWAGVAYNPIDDGSGSNIVNFANVELAGNAYDVNLSYVLPIEQGKTYELGFRSKSNVNRTILAGIGLNQDPWSNVTETVNLTPEWQTHSLTFTASSFGHENSRALFDMGAELGEVWLDDITLVEVESTNSNTDDAFDAGLLTNGDFTDGIDAWVGNAANPQDDGSGSNIVNYANVETAGDPWNVNLSQVVSIDQGKSYVLKFKAKSNGNRELITGIGLNMDPWTNVVQTLNLTTEWQPFELTLSAADFGNVNSRVLFDMGSAVGEVLIDDVSLMEASVATAFDSGLLANGDFEQENTSWLAGVENLTDSNTLIDDDGNIIYSVNVTNAGNPYDVNLSQKVGIEDGKSYKLNFKARTDVERTIAAGIGLSGDPWTNQTDNAIALTSEWQGFERTFTANFTAADSRVIFDMGAFTGLVQIDQVSLVEVSILGEVVPAATVIDFETPDTGSSFAWEVFENNDNPAFEVVSNPDTSSGNTSENVGKIIARASSLGSMPWAGAVTENLPIYTLDASNKVIKVMVYKSVISDTGVKLESLQPDGGKASTGEIKVANTVVNQWEELTFDFSGVIGAPSNTGITGFVFFPDFNLDGRATDTITYFDNVSFGQ